nr:BTB/POZ domain-containing protein 16-like [Biomphalaria glabrata]
MAEDTKKFADYSNLPSLPPKPPSSFLAYSRYVQDAPYKALVGVVIDAKNPEKFQVLPRHRMRSQTGVTNRWRFPDSLYSDMLGTKQALKSVNMPFNHSLANYITESSGSRSSHSRCTTLTRATKSANTIQAAKVQSPVKRQNYLVQNKLCSGQSTRSMVSMGSKKHQEPLLKDAVRRQNFLRPGKAHKKHDIVLKALGLDWELYSLFLHKSDVLAHLLRSVKEDSNLMSYSRNHLAQPQSESSRFSYTTLDDTTSDQCSTYLDLPHSSVEGSQVIEISMDIDDPLVSQRGLGIALSCLYADDLPISAQDLASVLAAASVLKFDELVKRCERMMLTSITYKTVCQFHKAASKYNLEAVALACECWLELNLIPKLSMHIELADLDSQLLEKILNSNRLFTINELSVFKTLCTWLFLELNPQVQMMPPYTTVITYFNSLPKHCPFLEAEEGIMYQPLFVSLRLHGIMDSNDIQNMLLMNILPYRWIVDMLSQQHKSLCSGGDMMGLRAFHKTAIRQGIVVEGDTKNYSEILSLYGFFFELKVMKQDVETPGYVIYFQRLKPNDSAVGLKNFDRSTFSMRSERVVKYSITVQYLLDSVQHIHSTGVHAMSFGLLEKTCRSQVLSVDMPPDTPMFVTFAVLLPPT